MGSLWRILKTSWPAFLVLAMPPLLVIGLLAWALATWGLAFLAYRQWAVGAASPGASRELPWLRSREPSC